MLGCGFGMLCDVGIDVCCGLFVYEVGELNIGFVLWMMCGCLWVWMKIVVLFDGCIVLLFGES